MNTLTFPILTAEVYCNSFFNGCADSINIYLVNYKLPEDLVITPSTTEQFYQASAKNRYIRSVTVKAN